MQFVYMQNAIKRIDGSTLRLTIPKGLKEHLRSKYNIKDDYLIIENPVFNNLDKIKTITVYPPNHGECKLVIVYEVEDIKPKEDNGKVLSLDFGLHNLITAVNATTGESFIVGRRYLWYEAQSRQGVKHPKGSNHINSLYERKSNVINDYLHKVTRYIVDYAIAGDITTVVVGNIKGIRADKDFGHKTNQKLHGLPYDKLYLMLEYKFKRAGILFVKETEEYSSQCYPLAESVDKQHARKSNRKKRGLYVDGEHNWNADTVGAYNIARLYIHRRGKDYVIVDPDRLQSPRIIKVAV